MALEQARCYYHAEREAVAKCENCNRMVCLEDKMTYRRYGGIDQAQDVFTYCPVCYNEAMETSRKFAPIVIAGFGIFAIIAIAIFILFAMFIMNSFSNF